MSEPDPLADQVDLPTDPELEARVIGLCLLGVRDHVTEARRLLPTGWAYEPAHIRIWDVICRLDDDGHAADLFALGRQAAEDGSDLTGEDLLRAAKCYENAPVGAQLGYYLGQATKLARLRAASVAATHLQQSIRRLDLDQVDRGVAAARTALDELAAGTRPADDDWAFVDLETALAGGTTVSPPNVLYRSDGVFLLYPGRVHSIAGEPEGGKSWVAIVAALQCLQEARNVVYIDYEDTAAGIVSRLLALGATPDQIRAHLYYTRPERGVDTPAQALLAAEHDRLLPAFVVVDGVTEAMMSQGLEIDGQTDVAKFYDLLPRFVARLAGEHQDGPAVLLIDHVTKDKEHRGRYQIGAQHKLAGISGAAYTLERIKPFTIGGHGIARISIAKDRHSLVRTHAAGEHIAELHIDSTSPESATYELRPVSELPKNRAGRPRYTILMEMVSMWLEQNPGASVNKVKLAIKGKSERVAAALECLSDEGYVEAQDGPRGALLYASVKPFRIEEGKDDEG